MPQEEHLAISPQPGDIVLVSFGGTEPQPVVLVQRVAGKGWFVAYETCDQIWSPIRFVKTEDIKDVIGRIG